MPEEQNTQIESAAQTPINPLDVVETKADDSNLLSNIVSAETNIEGNILEQSPELDSNLLEPTRLEASILLKFLKFLFVTLLFIALAAFLFFNMQLTDKFNFLSDLVKLPNVSQDLSSMNSEIIKLQSDVNYYTYLELNGNFNLLTFHSDSFINNYKIANSQTSIDSEKNKASNIMTELKPILSELISSIRALYVKDFVANLASAEHKDDSEIAYMFENQLLLKLNAEADAILENPYDGSVLDYKNTIYTARLVSNHELEDILLDPNFDFDAMNDEEIYKVLRLINANVVNDLSVLQNIKNNRVKWSDIINEIKAKTIEVDNSYSDDTYEELGGIIYTSYDFDTENRTVEISGETKTVNGKNFTMIAELIDNLNTSALFKDADMRSFSKSGSYDEGYVSSLKLSLKLIENE